MTGKSWHARVRLELHIPGPGDDEDVINAEVQFAIEPGREQVPFVMRFAHHTASLQTAVITALIRKGLLDPMTTEEKAAVAAFRYGHGAPDERN